MDAKTIASMPPKLLAQYLRDPQLQMAMQMQQEGTDTSPVAHWTQGLARMLKSGIGAYQQGALQEKYGKQAQEAANERQAAMLMATGRPAETQQVGDRTINWDAQQPNLMGAARMLSAPDNQDLASALIGQQFNQQQMAQQQAFAQQQQERQFQQQYGLQEAMLNRQMAMERMKSQNDPLRQMMQSVYGLQQQQPQQQQASQSQDGLSPAGIQLDMPNPNLQQAAPQQAAPSYDPRITSMAMTAGLKMPDGMGLDSTGKNFVPLPMSPKPIPAEQAARMALGDVYLKDAPEIRQGLEQIGSPYSFSGIMNRAQLAAGVGTPGELALRVQSGADALQRNLTGAGMSNAEADKYIARYVPSATDTQERLLYKHDQLVKELQATSNFLKQQYGQMPRQAMPQKQAPAPPSGFDIDSYLKQRGLQ